MFLLSGKNKDKLMVIYLLSYSDWTTDKLSLKLNRKKRYTKELLKEVSVDVNYYLDEELTIQLFFDGVIQVSGKSSEEILRLFYVLKLAYLEEKPEFKLLHLFLQKPILSTRVISEELFLSLSYTRRIIKRMNTFLRPFYFQIIEENGLCQIIGNELSIRLFLYVLMNDTYHSLPWPYTRKVSSKEVDFRQSLHIILTILNSRKYCKSKIPALKEKSHWIVTRMKENYNFIPQFKFQSTYFKHSFDEADIEDYFIFFTHICAPQIIPKNIKVALGKIFMDAPTTVPLFSKSLSCKIIKEFHLNYHEEKKYLLVYYLTVLDCFYELMQETTTLFESLVFPPLQYSLLFEKLPVNQVLLFFRKFIIEESRRDLLENEKLQHYYCGLIYTILQIETPPIVRIYLHFTKALTAQDLIQTRLESIYNPNTVLITSCLAETDLIVTDSLNCNKNMDKEIIYFNTILQEDQWGHLLKKINQLVLKKIAQCEKEGGCDISQ